MLTLLIWTLLKPSQVADITPVAALVRQERAIEVCIVDKHFRLIWMDIILFWFIHSSTTQLAQLNSITFVIFNGPDKFYALAEKLAIM